MRALASSLLVLFATPALAYPLMAPRPVPDAIAGPTDPHVAATFYNPAAMGYLRGVHFFADSGARFGLGSITRDGSASQSTNPIGFDGFAGLTWDLATETLNIGVAVYTPFTEFSSYAPTGPLRFHEQSLTFATLEETLAGAWQIERHIAIGAAFLVNESWLDYGYARDLAPAGGSATVSQPSALCGGAPCGYENPLAEQQIRLRGFDHGFGFVVGLIVRPADRVWLGVSYTNHKAGGDISLTDPFHAEVTPAPGQGAVCGGGACTGRDRVLLVLPEMVQAGLRVTVFPTFDIEASWRFIHYGARTALDVSLQSGSLGNAAVPPQFLLDRGLQNTYLVEVSTRHQVTPALKLSPSLSFETSAVAADAVNAAAIDAPKLSAALTIEWRAWHKASTTVTVGAHVGASGYILGRVRSRFDAQAETACVDAAYSLDACGKLNFGDALPSASGSYTYFVVDAGAALGIQYQP
ncbi:MAG TPA: outer membrane protein transport protein [Polyangia bacterium]